MVVETIRDSGYVPWKLYISFGITAIGLLVFALMGEQLIALYLHDTGNSGSLEATLMYARRYLRIMMIELLSPIVQVYSGTLRETERPASYESRDYSSIYKFGFELYINFR